MGHKRNCWLLNVLVALGWLLLVIGIAVVVTPPKAIPMHNGFGKIALMWVLICAISWLSRWQEANWTQTQAQ